MLFEKFVYFYLLIFACFIAEGVYLLFEHNPDTDEEKKRMLVPKKILFFSSVFLLLFFFIPFDASSQASNTSKIDSLQRVLKKAKEKEKAEIYLQLASLQYKQKKSDIAYGHANKALELAQNHRNYKYVAKAMNMLGSFYFSDGNIDKAIEQYKQAEGVCNQHNLNEELVVALNEISIFAYYKQDMPAMLEYSEKTLKVAKQIKDSMKISEAYNHIGLYYYMTSDFRKTLEFWEKELEIIKQIGSKTAIARIYNNLGVIYKNRGDYQKAIEYYQENLKIQEELNDTTNMALSLSNIGTVYYAFGVDFNKALEFYRQALALFLRKRDTSFIGNALINIGLVYQKQKSIDTALRYFDQALKLSQIKKNVSNMAIAQGNIGVIYLEKGDYDRSIDYSSMALSGYTELGDKRGVSSCYKTIGEAYFKKKNHDKSLEYYNRSISILKEIGLKAELGDVYKEISDVYKAIGDHKEALRYYTMYSERKDSSISEEYLKTIQEMQTKYETDLLKREKTNLELVNKTQEVENKRQRMVIYFFVVVMLIILGFSVLLYRQFKQIQKQRDQIVHQKQEITDSIMYASRIQRAILPPREILSRNLPEHFILYKPRDIVSGDFYWMTSKGDVTIFTAADCTGHGVPGAFMSMLGTAFLNEIVSELDDVTSNYILDKLRRNIVTSLHQTGKEGESKDGMDIALCVINHATNTLQYSGAYNPLLLIRNGELHEYKADKMPIGIFQDRKQDFSRHDISLQKGDALYVFSDGYIDQFGGPDRKKFMKKNFKNLLLQIQDLPMEQQGAILDKKILEWMGPLPQIDDILVIGVKI